MSRFFARNDPHRRLLALRKHLGLLAAANVPALVASVLWSLAYAHDLHFPKEDEGIVTGAAIMMLAVAYSITTTLVFTSVWERYQKVVVCILKKDQATFMLYRDERIPLVIYMLIAALSVPLLVMIGGLEYHSAVAGFMAVYSVAFVLSLYWVVIVELQTPVGSVWLAERIPADWLKQDVDEFFQLSGHPPQ